MIKKGAKTIIQIHEHGIDNFCQDITIEHIHRN